MEAEDVLEKFGELSSKRVGWSALFAVSLVLFAIQAIEKLIKGTSFVGNMIQAGVHDSKSTIEVALWLVLIVSCLIMGVIVLLVILGHAAALQRAEAVRTREATQSREQAQRCLTDMMHAASVIRSQQTPSAVHTIKTYERIRVVYRIRKDFTTSLVREYTIRAATDALHFWELSINPSSHADPVEYLSQIHFKVMDASDPNRRQPMTYLQTEDDLRLKRICIYFLPRLLKSDPAKTIEVSYEWPKHFEELRKKGREPISLNFNSAEPTASVRVELYIEDGTGGKFDLDIVSTYPHVRTELKETGWSGYAYEALNLPPGRHEHKLSASWSAI